MKILSGFFAISVLLGASAPLSAADLTIATGAKVTSLDPHFHNVVPNNMIAKHFFESLVDFDANQKIVPALAVAWRATDDRTWEFTLRAGARFANGAPVRVEDVAASFRRAANIKGSPSSFLAMVKDVEVVRIDDRRFALRTPQPRPLLPALLANIAIVDAGKEEATTADFNSGSAVGGSGPYRLVAHDPGDGIVMERNPLYDGPKPEWDRVTFRMIVDNQARMAALLSGSVQLADQVPPSFVATLEKNGNTRVERTTSTRLMYLHLDQFRDATPFAESKSGSPLGSNPLKDPRVRLAISKAINRNAIVEKVFGGEALPAGGLLAPSFAGASPKLTPERLDVEGARRLLAEAGYPDGFRLTLHASNDRYLDDDIVAQSLAPMLTRVGIETKVVVQPWAIYATQASAPNHAYSAMLFGWGTDTGEVSSPLRAILATPDRETGLGAVNRGRYSNKAVDEALAEAMRTVDENRRLALLREASEIAIGETAIVPLYYPANIWGMRKDLSYEPQVNDYTLAMKVRKR